MNADWVYHRRDPAALTTTCVVLALLWMGWRHMPAPELPHAPDKEMVVAMEDLPPPPPPPVQQPLTPEPPPPANTPPVPVPAKPLPATPTPAAPTPVPTAAPTATASPVPQAVAQPVAPQPVAQPAPQPVVTPPAPRANAAPAHNVSEQYLGELRTYLNGIKRYPTSREARQLRPQGLVKVWLEIDRAGQLLGVGVEASSGTLLLDNEALRTVRNGRYQAFPAEAFAGQPTHRFVIPIEYVVDSAM